MVKHNKLFFYFNIVYTYCQIDKSSINLGTEDIYTNKETGPENAEHRACITDEATEIAEIDVSFLNFRLAFYRTITVPVSVYVFNSCALTTP